MLEIVKDAIEAEGYEVILVPGHEIYVFWGDEFLDCLTLIEIFFKGTTALLRSYFDNILLEVSIDNGKVDLRSLTDHLEYKVEWIGCELMIVSSEPIETD